MNHFTFLSDKGLSLQTLILAIGYRRHTNLLYFDFDFTLALCYFLHQIQPAKE